MLYAILIGKIGDFSMASTTAVAPQPLNHYLTEVAADNARSLGKKAFMYETLEKISWLALTAIMATVLYISYTSVVLSSTASLMIAGMTLSTIFISWGISEFSVAAGKYANRAEIEMSVADQFEQIKDWSTENVHHFLEENNIDANRIPQDALRQMNPEEPLKALLPLIARFQHLKADAENLRRDSLDSLNRTIEERIAQKEREDGPMDPNKKRRIRHEARDLAYRQYEQQAIPRTIDAAIVLHLIQMPTIELSPLDLGTYQAKRFEERIFDRLYPPVNDNYFVFDPSLNREPLTLDQIERNANPSALRLLLFPRG